MGLKKTENQVQVLLKDTILALCRNTLNYHAEIGVEGLLCITLDCEEVLLVNINQTIKNKVVRSRGGARRGKRKLAAKNVRGCNVSDEISAAGPRKAKCSRATKQEEAAVMSILANQCANNDINGAHNHMNLQQENPNTQAACNQVCTQIPELGVSEDIRMKENMAAAKPPGGQSCEEFCIVKEEPSDIVLVRNENSVLMPPNEMYQGYYPASCNANKGQHHNASDGTSHFHSPQNLGQIAEEVLPNLNQAIGGSDILGSLSGSTSVTTAAAGPSMHLCLLCGKSFAWQWLLKRHQVVHSGDKDYSCEHCQRTFSYQSSVKRHQEKCAARLENLQGSSGANQQGPGVSREYAPGGATSQGNYCQSRRSHRNRYDYGKAEGCSSNTASGAYGE